MTTTWTLRAVIIGVVAAGTPAFTAETADIEAQRVAFREVYAEAERGNWAPVRKYEPLLKDYVLWPDLRASYLKARVDTIDHAEIEAFLDEYGTLKPARELRYEYSLHLMDAGHHAEFLNIYRQYYHDLGIAKLDCLASHAEILEGRADNTIDRALKLWLTGKSQADECDPVFAHLRANNVLSDEYFENRFALAVAAKRFSLARYLSQPLAESYAIEADHWLKARDDSLQFVRTRRDRGNDQTSRAQLIYALQRIAFSDPLLAAEQWSELKDEYEFADDERHEVSRHIALWAARRQLPEAKSLLFDLPPDAQDAEVRRWRIRTGLRLEDWHMVARSIASLPEEERTSEEWQYWEAIALKHLGREESANDTLRSLSSTRSYYGFLASDAIDSEYTFSHSRLVADDSLAEKLLESPALNRARELFYVGLEGRGRAEWDVAISEMSVAEQTQAAILSHRWGWHSRAIATASMIRQFDDLEIRYPLPWREDFEQFARDAGIRDSWVYGIARSESLFMRDIRSAAGAIGIMQILPGTARRIAREVNEPYHGSATLTDRIVNIRLGTIYLKKLLERFDENRVLATAAYNAGPLNVDEWLPATGAIDARIWIENIPFDETRDYVRRVLTAETIFQWRLSGQAMRLSAALGNIAPKAGSVANVD